MPYKFVNDLRFHEVLQTTIIWQIMIENEEIEKIEKYSQNPLELCTNLYVCLWVCVCVFVWVIIFTNPSARAGYDTRSIFKRSLTGLNSEFSFS